MSAADYLDLLAAKKRRAAAISRHSADLIRDALALEAAAADLRAGLHLDDFEGRAA